MVKVREKCSIIPPTTPASPATAGRRDTANRPATAGKVGMDKAVAADLILTK
jgi:hypothetical protein